MQNVPWTPELSEAAYGVFEALLIGLIIGAQRESQKDKHQAGLRDFMLIALAGGVCGLLEQIWLTVAALLSIALLLAVYRWQASDRKGITTEMAAVVTFCIAVMTGIPGQSAGSTLAIGTAIVMVAFLEAKRSLQSFIRETITETEFNDTIWFLAIVFVIHPLLPDGHVDPYEAVNPKQIWLFVILVSSISYLGYFLQKFMGTRRGLVWTSILGGIASTTAATLAFSKEVRERQEAIRTYWGATVIANAVQFPRVLLILYVINQQLALSLSAPLLIMSAAGLVFGFVLFRGAKAGSEEGAATSGNPFRLIPALKFGAVFAAIVFVSKLATEEFGGMGLYWASALGGTMDADAVAVSVSNLEGAGSVSLGNAMAVVLLALFMNAVLKTGLAIYGGGRQFGWRVASGFVLMFGIGSVCAYILGGYGI